MLRPPVASVVAVAGVAGDFGIATVTFEEMKASTQCLSDLLSVNFGSTGKVFGLCTLQASLDILLSDREFDRSAKKGIQCQYQP
jgi:hypothetical protein